MTGVKTDASAWARANLAAKAFALDWLGSGVVLRSGPCPSRDVWLQRLRAALPQDIPMRRIPVSISDDRLNGGLDIGATIQSGRPVMEPGILALADGGVLVLAMAERVSSRVAARLAAALDSDKTTIARARRASVSGASVGLVMLDEGCDDSEAPPAILLERCSYMVDLSAVSSRDIENEDDQAIDFGAARARLAFVSADPSRMAAVVAVAAHLGISSLRAPLMALRAARAISALDGRREVGNDDVALAATLTLSPRSRRLPEIEAEEEPEEVEPPHEMDSEPDRHSASSADDDRAAAQVEDVVLAAAKAAIPKSLLAQIETGSIARRQSAGEGKSGESQISSRCGRPIAARTGSPREGRVSFVATLRAAAPWQPLRRRERPEDNRRTVLVRREDFRIVRYQKPRGATAIFVVDASGSSSMHRLAEVKGAIELLLADCYVRRDCVALIAFRGRAADIVLPPTRSTARARRSLAGLPAGGGTPIASGLDAAAALADQVQRKGQLPLVVLMTDGRANVCRDGGAGRERAMSDAIDAARRLRAAKIRVLAIDTSAHFRSSESAATREIADAMGARYVKLPRADAAHVNEAVRASWRPPGP